MPSGGDGLCTAGTWEKTCLEGLFFLWRFFRVWYQPGFISDNSTGMSSRMRTSSNMCMGGCTLAMRDSRSKAGNASYADARLTQKPARWSHTRIRPGGIEEARIRVCYPSHVVVEFCSDSAEGDPARAFWRVFGLVGATSKTHILEAPRQEESLKEFPHPS